MQKRVKDCLQCFTKFTQKVQQIDYMAFLQKAQNIYAVRQFKVSQLTLGGAIQIYQNILYKFSRNMLFRTQLNWWQNQLRIFVWTLILYVEIKELRIQSLTEDDWEFFSKIFPNKKLILFEYQSINILKQHGQAKKWMSEEDKIFGNLVKQKGLKCKWSELAKLLYIESEKNYFRTPKQCRQRWLNHLDPSKSKSQWDPKQDLILIRYVYEKQKRWAEISKLLANKRNEHSIKNRFKSLITKEQKFHSQPLQQSQLIQLIYQRYKKYFENLIKNQDENIGDMKKTEKNFNFVENKNFRSNLQQAEKSMIKIKENMQKLAYPFNWITKEKKPNQIISIGSNIPQILPTSSEKQYSPYTHQLSQFDGRNFLPRDSNYCPLQPSLIFPKVKTFNQIPLNYENPSLSNINKFHSLNFIPQPNQFDYNNYSAPLQENEQDFFPSNELQLDQESSDFYQDKLLDEKNGKHSQMHLNQKINSELDQHEQRIRADILLAEDPFELLKPYFFMDIELNQQTQSRMKQVINL